MTLTEAIEEFDMSRSNNVAFEQKIRWISELEHKISSEYLEIRGGEKFEGYTTETPRQTELKAPKAFCEIYSLYLNMKMDYSNGEISRFNNSAMLFNRLYKEMGDAINRKTPVSKNTNIKAGILYV